MAYIMVDVETDGPIPGRYSMIAIGSVVVEPGLGRSFQARLRPISAEYVPQSLSSIGLSRAETLSGSDPKDVMRSYELWLQEVGGSSPRFISDNNGFDWMFVCWYFHQFLGRNPFGYSSANLGSLYKGLARSTRASFKHLRQTAHTHDPLDDARGNAEALLYMKEKLGLEIDL